MSKSDESDVAPLEFSVVECSSEEDGHGCVELHDYRENGVGWISEAGCEYPQTLILKILHRSEISIVHRLEILCHECKIAEKIEISIGDRGSRAGDPDPESFDQCESVTHLGYITMDPNKRSEYNARELKSIPIDKQADFIRLDLMECYENPLNTERQVGIVGVRLIGTSIPYPQKSPANNGVLRSKPIKSPTTSNRTNDSSDLPVKKIEIPVSSVASLSSSIKNELDPKIQNSVERLERMKKERAALEDFDTAAKIKESLGYVYALLTAFKESENMMRDAAAREDYVEASRLKLDRDTKRATAISKLTEVEEKWVGRDVKDLSISTIKDESFVSHRSLQSFDERVPNIGGNKRVNSPIRSKAPSPIKRNDSDDESSSHSEDDESISNDGEPHPLEGVDGAEELPVPEEVNTEDGSVSSDFLHKVEDLVGKYRARCLFSKNWMLREAALTKMALLVPQMFIDESRLEHISEIICCIILRAIDDRHIQVYLAGLVLLDDSVAQFEEVALTPQTIHHLLSKIITNLILKLADSKQKVVDSAELALLSLAHSSCSDISHVCNAATKRIKSDELKGGRTCKARIQFLENLVAEFGGKVSWERAIEFAKTSKAFEHRDSGVRDAAKSMVTSLMIIHGEKVLRILDDCEQVSERQLNEFRAKYAMIQGQFTDM